MRRFLLLCAVASMSLGACGEPLTADEKELREIDRKIAAAKKETAQIENSLDPQDSKPVQTSSLPAHEIISDKISQPLQTEPKKRSVDVRLTKRIAKDELESLGQAIRLLSPHRDRLFITYYLPGQTVGSGAWGSTHFTPKLDMKIHGMTLEQANDPFPALPKGATLMAKFAGNEFMGEKAIIFKATDGTTQKTVKYKDGSGATNQLFPAANGRLEARNGHGEYYVIKAGAVSVYDSSGLIDTYTTAK